MRSRFRRPERTFRVSLTVHRLNSIPPLHRLLYLFWRCRRSSPPEGRTPSKAVEPGNIINFDTLITFALSIPADPTDPTLLPRTPLTLQLRSERRARWTGMGYRHEGVVEVDLADIAASGGVDRNYLVQDSMLNTTLKLCITVTHVSGDKIFRTSTHSPVAPVAPEVVEEPDMDGANSSATLLSPPENGAAPPVSLVYNSIPAPHVAQRYVYEELYAGRLRDVWPTSITHTRVHAETCIEDMYNTICESDGIGNPVKQPVLRDMHVGVQGGVVTHMLLTRKRSIRKSASLAELSIN